MCGVCEVCVVFGVHGVWCVWHVCGVCVWYSVCVCRCTSIPIYLYMHFTKAVYYSQRFSSLTSDKPLCQPTFRHYYNFNKINTGYSLFSISWYFQPYHNWSFRIISLWETRKSKTTHCTFVNLMKFMSSLSDKNKKKKMTAAGGYTFSNSQTRTTETLKITSSQISKQWFYLLFPFHSLQTDRPTEWKKLW